MGLQRVRPFNFNLPALKSPCLQLGCLLVHVVAAFNVVTYRARDQTVIVAAVATEVPRKEEHLGRGCSMSSLRQSSEREEE